MEISFSELKNKEVINVFDGKKLGHIIDILFDNSNGQVQGVVVPGDKKLFRKTEDVFVPLSRIKKIGDDVILVVLQGAKMTSYQAENSYQNYRHENVYDRRIKNSGRRYDKTQATQSPKSFIRYKRIDEKKYK